MGISKYLRYGFQLSNSIYLIYNFIISIVVGGGFAPPGIYQPVLLIREPTSNMPSPRTIFNIDTMSNISIFFWNYINQPTVDLG